MTAGFFHECDRSVGEDRTPDATASARLSLIYVAAYRKLFAVQEEIVLQGEWGNPLGRAEVELL
jgi:hypothetical protein